MMLRAIDEGEDLQSWWQSYNLAHCLGIVKESLNELSEHCINSSWKKLWPSAVNDFSGFLSADAEILKIKSLARRVKEEGFEDMWEEKILDELLDERGRELTNEEMEDLLNEEEVEEEDRTKKETSLPQVWTLDILEETQRAWKHLESLIAQYDPSLENTDSKKQT